MLSDLVMKGANVFNRRGAFWRETFASWQTIAPKGGKTEAGQSCGRSHGADQGEAQRARGRTRGHGRPSRIATGRAREAENCGARENSNAAEKRCQEAKARRRQAVMLHVSFLSRACEQYRRDGPSGSPQDLWKQVSRQGRESSVEGVCLQMPFLCRPRG